MSVIQFCTNTKGYLPHYFYIFRKPEQFCTETNIVACYILGTMLNLDIQKGKEAMKIFIFQKYLGVTAACTERLAIDTIGCVQLTSNGTYFSDICFSGV